MLDLKTHSKLNKKRQHQRLDKVLSQYLKRSKLIKEIEGEHLKSQPEKKLLKECN